MAREVRQKVNYGSPVKTVETMAYYLLFWSGAPILRDLATKWNGTLPWSK